MINILRKNQKALWIVIALLCIPFVFYFSNAEPTGFTRTDLGEVYGRPVTQLDMQRNVRMFELARALGMFTYLQDMIGNAGSEQAAREQFVWNRLILRHEAEQLGIAPSGADVARVIKTLPPFQGERGFDIAKYTAFTQNALPSLGFGEAELEEVVVDQLTLERLKEMIGVGAQIPESETRENYERAYGKMAVTVLRVRSEDAVQNLQVNDDIIGKYYEARKNDLKSDEKRKVSYVAFALNEEQKKLQGRERVEALQKLADAANDFSQALLEKGARFDEVAARFQLPVQVTGAFTRTQPDPALAANPKLAEAAFQLTREQPNSDPVQSGDGFYVMHLAEVEEAKPLSLEEARPQIVEALTAQQTRALVASRGGQAAVEIREALKNNAPLEPIAEKSRLQIERIPPFALADPPVAPAEQGQPAESPDLPLIKRAVAELKPGEVSEFVPTATGGFVAVLEKREPPDPAKYEEGKKAFADRYLKTKRELAFYEWLRERRREAGVPEPQGPPAMNAPMPG